MWKKEERQCSFEQCAGTYEYHHAGWHQFQMPQRLKEVVRQDRIQIAAGRTMGEHDVDRTS